MSFRTVFDRFRGGDTAEKAEEKVITRRNFKKLYPLDMGVDFDKENPRQEKSAAWKRYEKIKCCVTVGEVLETGGTYSDIAWAYDRGVMRCGRDD